MKQAIDFSNTSIAFRDRSDNDLRNAALLFAAFNRKWLLTLGPPLAKFAFSTGIPVKGLIKGTIFRQFCGGESIEDCAETIARLSKVHIGTILDFSVEGQEEERVFDQTVAEIIRTIEKAASDKENIPFSVFKVTGIARFEILAKASDKNSRISTDEQAELERVRARFVKITDKAAALGVPIFIDAEESWIQAWIDEMVTEASAKHNRDKVIIYNTLQMYRHDRIAFMKEEIGRARQSGYMTGFKVVRGAYMEKERKRATQNGYASPIQPDKQSSDRDYDLAIKICLENIDILSLCAGTHNEESCRKLCDMMQEKGIAPSDKRIYFAQLLGMSDHISYNLADRGYNVAKYVPYGPVQEVLPYLVRRAEENSSVKGQAGRELSLINKELERRKNQRK